MNENDSALFKVDVDNYNGPLDVLLELVHKNKFDLKNLPILSLCNQYNAFIVDLKNVTRYT